MFPALARVSAGPRVGAFLAAFFAAFAVSTAFLPLWLADRGLDAGRIGDLLGLVALLRVAAGPAWGQAADAIGRRRPAMLLAASLAAAAAALFPATGGALLALAVCVQGVAAAALTPLTDALSLGLAAAGRLDYGRTRAWGSVAYMVATAGAGVLVGRAGSAVVPDVLALGFGLAAGLVPFLPEAATPPVRVGTGTGRLLRTPAFRLTLLASALIQGSHAAYYSFAALHWRASGLSDALIGLLVAEGIVAEVALFVWGRPLVERLGPPWLTVVAASACLVRWTATAFTADPLALAAIQPLHAATFAFQHLSAMRALGRCVPPSRLATAQALLGSLGFALPSAALVWVSGWLYGRVGGLAFLLMAAVGGAALALAAPLRRALDAAGR